MSGTAGGAFEFLWREIMQRSKAEVEWKYGIRGQFDLILGRTQRSTLDWARIVWCLVNCNKVAPARLLCGAENVPLR